jgi:hypothetical protein
MAMEPEPKQTVKQVYETLSQIPINNTKQSSKLDLNSIKGYSQKRKMLKLIKMKEDCKAELTGALNIFDPHEITLNHTAVLFCAQIVEDIFCKPKQGPIKEEIVIAVCKQHFNEDPELVKMVLELIFDKIIKTSLFRRNKERILNVCRWLGDLFGMVNIQTNFSTNLKL